MTTIQELRDEIDRLKQQQQRTTEILDKVVALLRKNFPFSDVAGKEDQ